MLYLFIFFSIFSYSLESTRYLSSINGDDTANECLLPNRPCRTFEHSQEKAAEGDTIFFSDLDEEKIEISQSLILQAETREISVLNSKPFIVISPSVKNLEKSRKITFENIVFANYEKHTYHSIVTGKTEENLSGEAKSLFASLEDGAVEFYFKNITVLNTQIPFFQYNLNDSIGENFSIKKFVFSVENSRFLQHPLNPGSGTQPERSSNSKNDEEELCMIDISLPDNNLLLTSKHSAVSFSSSKFRDGLPDSSTSNLCFSNIFSLFVYNTEFRNVEISSDTISSIVFSNSTFYDSSLTLDTANSILMTKNVLVNPRVFITDTKIVTIKSSHVHNSKRDSSLSNKVVDSKYTTIACFVVVDSKQLFLLDSHFYDNKISVLFSMNVNLVEVVNSHFTNNHVSQTVGVAHFYQYLRVSLILVSNCEFTNNNGTSLVFDQPNNNPFEKASKVIVIKDSNFVSNCGLFGGVFHFSGSFNISFSSVSCVGNRGWYGGVMYISNNFNKKLYVYPELQWEDNIGVCGGTIFMEDVIEFEFDEKLIYSSALSYGDFYATLPKYLYLSSLQIGYDDEKNFTISNETLYDLEIFPGEYFTIKFSSLDGFGQKVNTNATISVFEHKLVPVSGDVYFLTSTPRTVMNTNGEIVFSDIVAYGSKNSTFLFLIVGYKIRTTVLFRLTECPAYYEINEEGDGCSECSENYYKLTSGNTKCKKCIDGAICSYGDIWSEYGYWLDYDAKKGIKSYMCYEDTCGEGECEENFDIKYPICEACAKGYSKINGECMKCDTSFVNLFLFIVYYIIFFVIFFIFSHFLANTTMYSSAIDTMIYVSQSIFIIRNQEFYVYEQIVEQHYPRTKFVFKFMYYFQYIFEFIFWFGWEYELDIFKCPVRISPYQSLFFDTFSKFLTFFLIIFVIAVIKSAKEIVRKLKEMGSKSEENEQIDNDDDEEEENREKVSLLGKVEVGGVSSINDGDEEDSEKTLATKAKSFLKEELFEKFFSFNSFHNTSVFVFDVIFLLILYDISSFFSCKKFGDGRRILTYTSEKCFTSRWFAWSVYYVLILVIVLSVPFILFFIFFFNRKKIEDEDEEFSRLYGYFFENYKRWWFFVVEYIKKFGLVFVMWVTTSILSEDIILCYVLVAVFFFIYFLIVLTFEPYYETSENKIEQIALVVLISVSILRIATFFSGHGLIYLAIFWISFLSMVFFGGNVLLSNEYVQKLKKYLKGKLKDFLKKLKKSGGNENTFVKKTLYPYFQQYLSERLVDSIDSDVEENDEENGE